jgi:predicted nucleotidyltransferase
MSVDWQHCRENFERREADALEQREVHRQQARRIVLTAIAQIAPLYPQVQRVYLFGSITQPGYFRLDSDIDVAVEGTDAKTYFALWRDLEQACPGWSIDLRELKTPSYFTTAVRAQGELVYEHPHGAA